MNWANTYFTLLNTTIYVHPQDYSLFFLWEVTVWFFIALIGQFDLELFILELSVEMSDPGWRATALESASQILAPWHVLFVGLHALPKLVPGAPAPSTFFFQQKLLFPRLLLARHRHVQAEKEGIVLDYTYVALQGLGQIYFKAETWYLCLKAS